jgi:hypothetical protein
MLQCSNYKVRSGDSGAIISRSRKPMFHATFTTSPISPLRPAAAHVISTMGHHAGAQNLRDLLSVAAKLRHLANVVLCQGDRGLYLMAAEALETRAGWLAAALPQEIEDGIDDEAAKPELHKPVDLVI